MQIGNKLPLFYQLTDYSTGQFVLATLRTVDGALGDPIPLDEIDDAGLYGDITVSMPNTPWVLAKYAVYTDDTYTVLSSSEGGDTQLFELVPNPPVESVVGIVNC